jgi:hypothetical protein
MFSILNPSVFYINVDDDILPHDIDIVSDLWNMDGHEVYKGSRDPNFTHANVYWLYDQNLVRVGLIEHDLNDHAKFELLWYLDNPFGTLLQESGWMYISDNMWSFINERAYTRAINEDDWASSPLDFLETCLNGSFRVVTPEMLMNPPMVYGCSKCGKKSLKPISHSTELPVPLDYPLREKVVFVDNDFIIQLPPSSSRVFKLLRLPGDDSSLEPGQEQEQESPHLPPHESPQHPHHHQDPSEEQPQGLE